MRRWLSACAAIAIVLGTSLPAHAVDVNGCPIVPGAQCPAANLDQAVLPNSDLHNANLELATAKQADLQGSDIRSANLTKADFTNANLSDALLSGATLTATSFRYANLTQANLNAAITPLGGNLISVPGDADPFMATIDFTYGNLEDLQARGADLRFSSFNSASLWGASFKGSRLQGSDFRNSMAYQADFRNADLRGSNLADADFSGADMRGVRLDPYQLSHLNFICDKKTTFSGSHKKKLTKYCAGRHNDCPIILFPCPTSERPCGSGYGNEYGTYSRAQMNVILAKCYPDYAGKPWT